MAKLLVVGGGIVGLGLGMLLAADGHEATVLERDSSPVPGSVDEAWDKWERKGVNQFRLGHFFLPRFRQIVEEEIPHVAESLRGNGAVGYNMVTRMPDNLTSGARDGDEKFEALTGRRPVVERAFAQAAENTSGLDILRGVAVKGLLTGSDATNGIPHVTGVRTEDGRRLEADLVIDASGRRSAISSWLSDIGTKPPLEEKQDSGFTYLGRHFRSADGNFPVATGPTRVDCGSFSVLTLPADNGVWSIVVVIRSDDRVLLGLRDIGRWHELLGLLPTVSQFIEAEPLEDHIVTISKLEDRKRDIFVEGSPVATGIVTVGDSWACTNPSLGRGASIGLMHAQVLRDTLRQTGADEPGDLSAAFAAATDERVAPWVSDTLSFDQRRLDEMKCEAEGVEYANTAPEHELGKALAFSSLKDPDCLRAFAKVAGLLGRPADVLNEPGIIDKVIELGANWRNEPSPGPAREELLRIATA